MNCCEFLLNQNSCRFCLGDASSGSLIASSQPSYFRVDKRIVPTESIFSFLKIKVVSSHLPNRVCDECQQTIIAFYSLKKNFQDNELVLLGKVDEDSRDSSSSVDPDPVSVEGSVLPMVKEFLKENSSKCFSISKYNDRLSICLQNASADEEVPKKLKVAIFDKPCDSEKVCSKCNQEILENEANDFEMSDGSNLEPPAGINQSHEEYLDEDTYESMPPDIGNFVYEVKQEPSDTNLYSCLYCEKSFSSRSGRDTHQQLKHRCPEDFDSNNVTAHEFEIEADGKMCIVWKCPHCSHYSKKKDHHRTHLIRHAIREHQESEIKFEVPESIFPVEELQTAKEEVYAIEEPDEPPALTSVKVNDCQVMKSSEENSFFCSECLSKFPDEDSGLLHVQKFGNNGLCTTCVCHECSVVFPSQKLTKRHQGYHTIAGIANSLNYFDCLTCSVVFSNQNDLDNHLKLHVGLPSEEIEHYQYQAEANTKLDGCELQLKILKEEWMGTGRLRCAHCSKIGDREEINLHMTFFHANLICPFDRQQFSRSVGYFVEHLKAKHPEEFKGVDVFFKCPFCDENFSVLNEMKVHCKTCQEKRFSCNHCDKKFFQERQLKQHLALVNGTKNHKCSTCEKSFASKTELNVHQRSHSNLKPYPCTFPGCSKVFRTNSHRSSHMDTHSNVENYQCSQCSQRFKTRGARRVHEKTHDSGNIATCSLCLKDFRQRSHLIRHVKLVHRIECNSGNLEQVIGTQIQKVESSTVDVSSDDSNK